MLTLACIPSGAFIDVTDLAALPRRLRPECACYACERPLIPKLGSVVRHHFAHRPDSDCYAAGGEGLLHLEAKLRLARSLEEVRDRGDAVFVSQTCTTCGQKSAFPFVTLAAGDHVRVERKWDAFQPDIQIVREAEAIAVIEVMVTHASTDEKWRTLVERQVSALEVLAETVLGRGQTSGWTPDDPLLCVRLVGVPEVSECDGCTDDDRQRVRERRRREAYEAHRWNTSRRIVHAIFDLDELFRDGTRRSHRFLLSCVEYRGEQISARFISARGVVLKSWQGVETDGDLNEKALAVAREWARRTRTENVANYDPYTRLRMVQEYYESEEDGRDHLQVAEALALKEERRPYPSYWWLERTCTWVRCYHPGKIDDLFEVRPTKINEWVRNGRLRVLEVQRERGGKVYELFDADQADSFWKSFERWKGTQPRRRSPLYKPGVDP